MSSACHLRLYGCCLRCCHVIAREAKPEKKERSLARNRKKPTSQPPRQNFKKSIGTFFARVQKLSAGKISAL